MPHLKACICKRERKGRKEAQSTRTTSACFGIAETSSANLEGKTLLPVQYYAKSWHPPRGISQKHNRCADRLPALPSQYFGNEAAVVTLRRMAEGDEACARHRRTSAFRLLVKYVGTNTALCRIKTKTSHKQERVMGYAEGWGLAHAKVFD